MPAVSKQKKTGVPEVTAIKVKKLVRELRQTGKQSASTNAKKMEHFDRLMNELGKGLPELPALADDFSREDIYLNDAE